MKRSILRSALTAAVTAGFLGVGAAITDAAFVLAPGRSASVVQDEANLVKDLGDRDAKVRSEAVKGLARIGSKKAWEAIADRALGDLEPRVADEAQLQLGAATLTEAWLDAMDSKFALSSKETLVRERAAEALGRVVGAPSTDLFTRALKDKEASVRATAAFALEKRLTGGASALDLTGKGEASALRKSLAKAAATDRDERARANAIAALAALGRVDPETQALVGKALARQDRDALARAASLWAAGEGNTVADLVAGLRDETHGVAMVALGLLQRRGDRESMLRLAEALPEDEDGAAEGALRPALAWAIVAALRDASGLSYGVVRERWVRWAEGLASDWKRGADTRKGKAAAAEEPKSSSFYGLRLVSDRLVFVVDMSGSMWSKNGETSRKEQVEVELAKALRGLPETARFNVVPYANAPAPWEDQLMPATERNVEKAIDWFEHNTLRGKGDLWTALVPVLRDPNVDTVVILSDGAPSGGQRWNLEVMRWLLQDENRLRGVVIHAVMFDASRYLQRSWKSIVEDWGGVQQLID